MATQTTNPETRTATRIPSTMRAVVYRGVNDMRVETVPVPTIGPGELLVKVATCGICGTDLKKIHTGSTPPPHLWPRKCPALSSASARECRAFWGRARCGAPPRPVRRVLLLPQRHAPAQCPCYKKVGVTAGFEPSGGGFAEYIRVMDWVASSCGVVPIPDDIPFEQAAFLEPVNTVLKGVKMLNLTSDDAVAFDRPGSIGLMHVPVLAGRTGARVLTSDLYPERHAIAAKYGLKNPIHAGTENVVERVLAQTDGRGARCRHPRRRRQCPDQDRHGRCTLWRQGHAFCPDAAGRRNF